MVKQVFSGVVIGITVGLVLAASAAIFRTWTHDNERHEQISFVRELVGKMQNVCEDATELKTELAKFSADEVRLHELRIYVRHLRHTLDERSTRLTFDEIYEVEEHLYYSDQVLNKFKLSDFPKGPCLELVSVFEGVSWLGR